MQIVMDSGAKKVVIGGLGPLGCGPQALAVTNSTGACVGVVDSIVEAINDQIFASVDALNAKTDSTYVVLGTQFGSAFTIEEMGTKYGTGSHYSQAWLLYRNSIPNAADLTAQCGLNLYKRRITRD
jgi:hypothetical protein